MRLAFLLLAAGTALPALAQPFPLDFSVEIYAGSSVPSPGAPVTYALLVKSNPGTNTNEAFSARMEIPAELEVVSVCSESTFDPVKRVLAWDNRLDLDARASCPVTFRVPSTLLPGASFTLTASLTTPTPDTDPANNTAALTAVVRAASDLGVTSSADIRRFRPGATVTYTVTVSNRGPQDAQDVRVVDELSSLVTFVSFQPVSGPPAVADAAPKKSGPGGCYPPRCGDYIEAYIPLLPDRATATFQLVVQAKTSFESDNVANRASVESTSIDLFPNNNRHDLITFAGPSADLSLTGSAAAEAGGEIPITLQVRNDGPDTVQAVKIDNILLDVEHRFDFDANTKFLKATPSQGTCSEPGLQWVVGSPWPPPVGTVDCSLGNLASGATATITILVVHKPGTGAFTVASQVTPAQNDPNPANNISEVSVGFARRRAKR